LETGLRVSIDALLRQIDIQPESYTIV
jgi:hypothetical protein